MLGYRPPGGETVAEMHTRAQAFVAALPPAAPAVVVCHAGIMKSLCGHLLDLPLATWVGLSFDFGTVSRLDLSASGWRWLWHNKS
jgi:broad specificity phosphatase PhoE